MNISKYVRPVTHLDWQLENINDSDATWGGYDVNEPKQDDATDTALKQIMQISIDFAKTKLGVLGRLELNNSTNDILAVESDYRQWLKNNGLTSLILNGQTITL
jgi:hypothetical protein